MPKKQNRRSISIRGVTYQRAKNWCERKGQSISGLTEDLINGFLDSEDEPVPEKAEPTRARPVSVEDIASQHFTF